MTDYNFNAPQIIDFSAADDSIGDSFFEMVSPEINTIELKKTPVKDYKKEELSDLENSDPYILQERVQTVVRAKQTSPVLRKVLNEISRVQENTNNKNKRGECSSDVNDDLITGQLEKMHIGSVKKVSIKTTGKNIFDGIEIPVSVKKKHSMMTRLDFKTNTPVINLRSRSVIRYRSDCVSTPSQGDVSVASSSNSVKADVVQDRPSKFIALAEQVEHFYKDTPDRFRSKPKNPFPVPSKPFVHYQAKTPNLTAKFRTRQVHYLPPEERERLEIEEMKKHQIKAAPINQHLLNGPRTLNLKTALVKKPTTAFQPFNLTCMTKKIIAESTENVFQFKAQPVPRKILKSPQGIPPKKLIPSTTPYTPRIKVPARLRADSVSTIRSLDVTDKAAVYATPKKTVLQPFSFDERDKIMLQKKEDKIKEKIEEEKKLADFKANPIPKFTSSSQCVKRERNLIPTTVIQPFKLTERPPKDLTIVQEKPVVQSFKARPAIVLKSKPFEPKKTEHPPIVPFNINFSTEKRLEERKEFEEKLKRAELEKELALKKAQEEEEKRVKLEIAEQRKQTEFHAKPIPKPVKPFEIKPADRTKLTQPMSPVFRSGKSNMKKNVD